jgi:hypothetical protein
MGFGLDTFSRREKTHQSDSNSVPSRRRLLRLGATSLVVPFLPGRSPAQETPHSCAPPIPVGRSPSNGGPCPYPISWLDKNRNHNQPAGPNVARLTIGGSRLSVSYPRAT